MDDILYRAAAAFSNVKKHDYIYALGNRKRNVKISVISNEEALFTHISGLDHLTDIPKVTGRNETQKKKIYRRILNGEITFSDIRSSRFLHKPMSGSQNAATGKLYTVKDRIQTAGELEKILDGSYKGKMYRWNDGASKCSCIKADYLMVIPSENDTDEKIYLFLFQKNKEKKQQDIELCILSAFASCDDLTEGQASPFTVLELVKREVKTKKEIVLFTHPSYTKEKNLLTV